MKDVAQLAGVSQQTVSRVLSGRSVVSERARASVEEAVRALNYHPNRLARALATGQTQLIAVIDTGSARTGPSPMLESLDTIASAWGYALIPAALPAPTSEGLQVLGDRLLSIGVDGMIIFASALPCAVLPERWPIPVVVVQGSTSGGLGSVQFDDRAAAAAAVQHLLDMGHRQVWHIAGPEGWWESRHRRSGWRAALDRAGITPPRVLAGDWTATSGYQAGVRLAKDPCVTAIFAANDDMAAGVLSAFRAAGREVPKDISVVGFGDHPLAAYLDPPLSTVRTSAAALGHAAFMSLISALSPTHPARSSSTREVTQDSFQLIVRASTSRLVISR